MQQESLARSLKQHPFTTGMSDAELEVLSACAKNSRFAPGQYLFRENGPADTLFLIRRGQVALQSASPTRGAVTVETTGAGDVLGWSVLFEPYVWHIDARAVAPTLVFALDAVCLRNKLAQDCAFAYALTRRLLFVVHQRLVRARLQQLDIYKLELRG